MLEHAERKGSKNKKKSTTCSCACTFFFSSTTTYCTGEYCSTALWYLAWSRAGIDYNNQYESFSTSMPCCKNKIYIFYLPALTLQTCSENRKSLRWDAPPPSSSLSSISTVFLYVCLPSSGKLWFRWHQGLMFSSPNCATSSLLWERGVGSGPNLDQ